MKFLKSVDACDFKVYFKGMRSFSLLFGLIFIVSLSGCIGTRTVAPVTFYGASDGVGSAGVHTVSRGETLWTISQRYNIVMRDIVLDNKLKAPFILKPGQRLILPPPREYRVRQGDSISSISRIFDASQNEIARLNDLRSPYRIHPGDVLRLPSQSAQIASVSQKKAASAKSTSNTAKTNAQNNSVPVPSRKPVTSPRTTTVAKATSSKPSVKKRVATPKRASSKFLQPVHGRVLSGYGPKKDGLYNDGINIAAARGASVKAADNGVVVYAGDGLKESGNLILVRHADRWMTAYGHMDKIMVQNGAVIKRGQTIGTVGSTGAVNSPQLHFEVRRGTKALNPSVYLEK